MADAKGDDRFDHLLIHAEPMEHFVIVERGLLISHADVSERIITHEGETFRLGCVGEVMTHPAFRREGHGQRVIAAASDYIRAKDADVGMLFTMPELESFYGSGGWETVNTQGITFGDPAQPKFDNAFVMMLFVTEHGRAKRDCFNRGPIYVGSTLW